MGRCYIYAGKGMKERQGSVGADSRSPQDQASSRADDVLFPFVPEERHSCRLDVTT
jgi:hypothetical protein